MLIICIIGYLVFIILGIFLQIINVNRLIIITKILKFIVHSFQIYHHRYFILITQNHRT